MNIGDKIWQRLEFIDDMHIWIDCNDPGRPCVSSGMLRELDVLWHYIVRLGRSYRYRLADVNDVMAAMAEDDMQ